MVQWLQQGHLRRTKRFSQDVFYLGSVCYIIGYPIIRAMDVVWKRAKKSSEDGKTEVDASQKSDLS